MRVNVFALGAFTALAGLGLTSPASATDGRLPSSLLLGPEYDNRTANLTLVTITNTNCDFNPSDDNPNLFKGTTDVEIIYIGKFDANGNPIPCTETNRIVRLSPCDTFSFITSAHNPQFEQGFFYAFAKNPVNGSPWSFNYLIGNVMRINGIENVEYSTNLVAFKSPENTYNSTNNDGDAFRDLDGSEYNQLPAKIYIPRFIASSGRGTYNSELILMGLSGGALFTTVVDFLVYNDNEEVFSTQRTFNCWERVKLLTISGVFSNAFLQGTNHAPNEILGANNQEAGWMHINGAFAFSTVEQITEPGIYAVLVERIAAGAAASDLPWESGTNSKGDLFPHTILGDDGLNGQ